MTKRTFLSALALFNAATFLISTLFLPDRGSFSSSGPISRYINSRADWGNAFVMLLASLLISWGVYLLIRSRLPDEGDSETNEEGAGSHN